MANPAYDASKSVRVYTTRVAQKSTFYGAGALTRSSADAMRITPSGDWVAALPN